MTSARAPALPTPTDPPGEQLGLVHLVVDGDRAAPAVALVHGIPGSVRDWRYAGPALAAAGLCAVRFDMPGFGKTPARAFSSPKAENRAAFVRACMRALGFARFAVVGHSIGGATALMTAACFPHEVWALGLINSAGTRRHRGLTVPAAWIRTLGAVARLPVLGARAVQQLDAFYQGRGTKNPRPLDAESAALHLAISGDLDIAANKRAAAQVRCPALVASAHDDPLVELPVGMALARDLVAAPVVTHLLRRNGGHYLQKHAAAEVATWLALQAPSGVGAR
ncbi:MAG: alpha/beta fold hydrolase [Deltaproteobacteria bacterium]|nr:alpha/beta fold hydrolase [Deltaproteobacteria bacterium]